MLAAAVYLLCTLTSLACAFWLLKSYRRHGAKLLMWSGICFLGLACSNVLLVADFLVFPGIDLSMARHLIAAAALAIFVFGLIWDFV